MRTKILVSMLLIALGATAGLSWQNRSRTTAEVEAKLPSELKPKFRVLKELVGRLEDLQKPMGKIQPGDWLESHPEPGQTFAQFLEVRPVPIPAELTTFYVQPIGQFTDTQEKLLKQTARGLELFYGRKVSVLKPVEISAIPKSARRGNVQQKHMQVLSTYILDEVLKPKRPKDAIAVLALSAPDLWPGKGWNFVFGQASLTERVGVWSIARFGDPDESPEAAALCFERMLGTALHESGHMLGIHHCTAWNCCMNGSNNLEESDRRSPQFCAECQPKVWWACDLDPKSHAAGMAKFAFEFKLESVAEYFVKVEKLIP